ncbi:MAG: translocation/assembly module TamB domain-containing protein [Bacteroidota bacterium]
MIRGFLKILLWLFTIPLCLAIILLVVLQFQSVQTYLTGKATGYLSEKIKSKVTLRKITVAFPKMLALEELYVEGRQKDTLLYTGSLKVDIDLWALLSNKVLINTVELDKATAHISRTDTYFNFDFIVQAFSPAKEKKPEKSGSRPWEISLESVSLKNIFFTFHDAQSGVVTNIRLGEFKSRIKKFDLDQGNIRFGSATLKNTYAYIQIDPVVKKQNNTTPAQPFTIHVAGLTLDSVKTIYKDMANKQNLDVMLGHLSLTETSADLENLNFETAKLVLSGTSVIYTVDRQATATTTITAGLTSDTQLINWRVKAKDVLLSDNAFSYRDQNKIILKQGFDMNHFFIKDLALRAKDVLVDPSSIVVDLKNLSLKEQRGFELKNLSAGILYDSSQVKLSRLYLETIDSKIIGGLALRYPSIQQLKKDIGGLVVDLQFRKTVIALSEVQFFVPDILNDSIFNPGQKTVVGLNGTIKGKLEDLRFNSLEVKTQQNTVLTVNGSVKNIPDPKNLYLELNTFRFTSSEKDVFAILSKSVIPTQVKIPANFEFEGSMRGYLQNFNADLRAKTSIGQLSAKVKMRPEAGNARQPYDIRLSADNFDTGKLLNQTELLGVVTLTAALTGSGFNFDTLAADVSVNVQSAVFKKYEYKNLLVNGRLQQKQFTGKISIDDTNLAFNYDGTVSFDPKTPNYVFTLDLKGADLKALNLTEEELRVSAMIQSDIHDRSDKNFTGKASIKNALIVRDNKKYPLDSIVFISEFKEGASKITLRSEIMTADFNGDITLNQLPAALKQHANSYFNMEGTNTSEHLNAQKFTFEMKVLDASLLTQNLVPDLKSLSPFSVKGAFDSEARKLEVKGDVPQVIYDGITVDSLRLNINSDAEKLSYKLGLAEVSNPTFKFENVNLAGELKNNQLSFQLNTNKDDSAKTLAIGGIITEKNKIYTLKLNQELILNTEKWLVDPANTLQFGGEFPVADRLVISKGNSSAGFNSTERTAGPPLEIKFSNFELTTLSRLIENRNELAAGEVNGNIILEKHEGAMGFRSDLVINSFVFKSVPIGTIKLKADNLENPKKYAIDLGIEGNGNDLALNGSYTAVDKNDNLNFDLNVRNLNLASIEPFTFGEVTRMSGALNGKLNIRGNIAAPDITGEIYLKETAFRPKIIDSYLTVHNGKISFASGKMSVNNLVIYDSLNNKALLNGYAGIKDLRNISFDAQLKTANFLALNTSRNNNPLYFGRVFLDSDIKIRGDAKSPKLDMKAKLNRGSFITYVKPAIEIGKNESKGIVEFADTLYRPGIMTRTNDTLKSSSELKGIDLNASISFEKSVTLKMLVDQESGDSLYVTGAGSLDFSLDKNGKTTLTGKYRINDGGYHLGVSDLVKRNFRIEKGSSVTWSGDVLDPYIDLKAIYVIKTSPVDLVQDELSGLNELERNKYRNLLTFYVYLKMLGFISSPDISFDIQLAPQDRGAVNGSINNKLAQLRGDETEMNKQVFALLTLRRFIGDNPLDNGSDGGLTSASRSSASKVLTQQLSSISDKYVNFVDLDLGVNSFEDYSSGVEQGRTQLQLGVSKQLLNEKVTVRVGGNVELEGERARQNNANDVAGNISIDYKLTEDGRFKLKAFRENQYENPIEGELTKTGAGVVYVRNFRKFKELLKKPEHRKKVEINDPGDKELTDSKEKEDNSK